MKKIMKFALALFVLLMGIQVNPTSAEVSNKTVIVNKKDSWSYYNEAPDNLPGEDWYKQSFDDSNWKSGNGIMGYSTSTFPFDTKLTYGPDSSTKYPSYFFRKKVDVKQADLDSNDYLNLNLNIDDGAIVFINYQEIMRYNYNEGPIDYTGYASALGNNGSTYINNGFELEDIPLTEGPNTISVVVFQERGSSSDVAFDAELTLEMKIRDYTPSRINQTFHGDVNTSKAFTWHTPDKTNSDIRYVAAGSGVLIENGTMATGQSNRKAGLSGYSHKVLLEGLSENTTYKYQVGDDLKNIWSEVYTFTTGNTEDGINIGFITDSQGTKLSDYEHSAKTMEKL